MFKIKSKIMVKYYIKTKLIKIVVNCLKGVNVVKYISNNITKFQISKNMKCYKKLICSFLYQKNKNSENIKNNKSKSDASKYTHVSQIEINKCRH